MIFIIRRELQLESAHKSFTKSSIFRYFSPLGRLLWGVFLPEIPARGFILAHYFMNDKN